MRAWEVLHCGGGVWRCAVLGRYGVSFVECLGLQLDKSSGRASEVSWASPWLFVGCLFGGLLCVSFFFSSLLVCLFVCLFVCSFARLFAILLCLLVDTLLAC